MNTDFGYSFYRLKAWTENYLETDVAQTVNPLKQHPPTSALG